jgi:PGF-CTERM protein
VDPEDDTVLYGDDGDVDNDFDTYVANLGIIDDAETANEQLERPLQSTEYRIQVAGTTGLADDEAVFDADPGGDANNQLDSKTLRLAQPSVEGITIHTAPEEDADDITNAEDLVSVATPISEAGGEVGVNDRLIAQVEATGIFGSIVQEAGPGRADSADYDRLSEGASSEVLNALTDDDVSNESVSLSIEAGATTGNVDALEIDLTDGSDDSDVFIVPDHANDQFFIVTDTSSDNAFTGGGGEAPDSTTQFTAELEYDADNEDDRTEFESVSSGGSNPEPYEFTSSSVNYPYFTQGTVASASTEFTMAPQSITYDNLNADRNVQLESTEEATVSASTNVAPGADAEIRISGDGFQQGQNVNISSDGSITANFNTADLEVGSDITFDFRVSGSSVATDTGVIVEAVGDDTAETNETADDEADDGEDQPADDGEANETADDGGSADDGSTDDGTPGFGAVVALIALIGAALLAVRRQN